MYLYTDWVVYSGVGEYTSNPSMTYWIFSQQEKIFHWKAKMLIFYVGHKPVSHQIMLYNTA